MHFQAVALQFPLRHPAVKAVLAGVRTVQELEVNVAAFDEEIPAELWTELENLGLIDPAHK
jgi:D-threo-aldose 1-dehydrogenase